MLRLFLAGYLCLPVLDLGSSDSTWQANSINLQMTLTPYIAADGSTLPSCAFTLDPQTRLAGQLCLPVLDLGSFDHTG